MLPDYSIILGIIIYFIHFLTNLKGDSPCWCTHISKLLEDSKIRLLSRYQEENLDSTSVFSFSGTLNSLEYRLLETLETGKPFYIGVLGGSYSLPEMNRGNAWSYNVTRWLNTIFSISECKTNTSYRLSTLLFDKDSCEKRIDIPVSYRLPLANLLLTSKAPVLFCGDFLSDVEEASYHSQQHQLDNICDNFQTKQRRPCRVFGGSGKYARLAIHGGRNSKIAKWSMNSLGVDSIDLLIWDYSINDIDSMTEHLHVFDGYFEQALHSFPTLSTFLMMYQNNLNQIDPLNPPTWNNDLAAFDYPLLKQIFDPVYGKFSNHTLLTVSLPSYCNLAYCKATDIIDANHNQPREHGMALIADIVIWRLIKLFRSIYRHSCSSSPSVAFNKLVPWVDDGRLNVDSVYTIKQSSLATFQRKNLVSLQKTNQKYFKVWDVVATLQFSTPTIRSPLPISKLAFLCAPSHESSRQLPDTNFPVNVFDVDGTLPEILPWVEVDMLTLWKNSCAGFNHFGMRKQNKLEDSYCYSGTVTTDMADCISRTLPRHEACPPPEWNTSTFPHKYWPKLPLVKAIDLVFKASVSLDFLYICFLNCKPTIMWRNQELPDVWQQITLEKTGNVPNELVPCFSMDEVSDKIKSSLNNEYYIWYPGDRCFPKRRNQHTCQLNKPFYLIKPAYKL